LKPNTYDYRNDSRLPQPGLSAQDQDGQDETLPTRPDADETIASRLHQRYANNDVLNHGLIGILTEDLYAPLTVLLSYLEFWTERMLPDMTDVEHHYYHQMRGAIERITDMIADVQAVDRMMAGIPPKELVLLDVLAHQIAGDAPGIAALYQHHIDFHVDIVSHDGVVIGEAGLLRRAMQHLVSDAVRRTPHGGNIHIAHTMKRRAQASCAVFSVQDDGIPLSDDQRACLLELPARDGERHLSQPMNALAFVKAVIQAHGGVLFLATQPGQNAHIGFELPLVLISDAHPHDVAAV